MNKEDLIRTEDMLTMKGKQNRESDSKVAEFEHVYKRCKTLVLKSGVDRISQLPDDILHRIIFFLPQEENVGKTVFLSKRWLNLWTTTLPYLCFKLKSCNSEAYTGLMNFVDKLLSCREKSTFIKKFCLSCSRPVDTDCCLDMARVNDLIREVVFRHNVHELDLKLELKSIQFCSPFSVSSKSLTSLKLRFDEHCYEPNFPTYFSFPNLKTMDLTHVVLGTNFASQLSNNCCKLENLAIIFCKFVENLIPNDVEISLRPLPNLVKSSISLNYIWETCVLDFLPVISNVEVLSLKIEDHPWLLLQQLEKLDYFSEFHNLKSLVFGQFVERGIGGGVNNIMDNMLQSLPALVESLHIGFVWYNGGSEDGNGLIPTCELSHRLKVLRIEGVSPAKHLIELVKYFLEEAKGLEKMIVCKPKYCNQEERNNICQKLQALPNSGALKLCEDDTCGCA